MKLADYLHIDAIQTELKSKCKKDVIEELVSPLVDMAQIKSSDLVRVLMDRERLGSTGIGGGIGIPHGKCKALKHLILGFGLSREGVDFESIDGKPAHIFFLLVTPENSIDTHLKILAQISRILRNNVYRERLMRVKSKEEVLRIIGQEEEIY